MTTHPTTHLALIEWPNEDAEVILGPSWHAVAAAAASRITDPEIGLKFDPTLVVALEDEAQLRSWHSRYARNRRGDQPWVTFLVHGHPDSTQAVSARGASWAERRAASLPASPPSR